MTSFKAKKSENAVDIYFLLDISASMKPIQDRLVQVPNKLIEVSEAVKTFFVSFDIYTIKLIFRLLRRELVIINLGLVALSTSLSSLWI